MGSLGYLKVEILEVLMSSARGGGAGVEVLAPAHTRKTEHGGSPLANPRRPPPRCGHRRAMEGGDMSEMPSGDVPRDPTLEELLPFDLYIIVTGDTLTSIAAAHGVSVEDILALNQDRISDPDKIYAGNMIHLPLGSTK